MMDVLAFLRDTISSMSNSPGLWGFIGVLTGGLITHKFQQIRDRESQIRIAFAGLHGLKKSIKQLYVSRFEALVFSDFHEAKWRLSGHSSAIDFDEATRWMKRSEELVFEISKTEERLAQTCGSVLVNFKTKPDLVTQTKSLLAHSVPSLTTRPDSTWNAQQVNEWKIQAVPAIQAKVDEIFDPLFERLLGNPSFGI